MNNVVIKNIVNKVVVKKEVVKVTTIARQGPQGIQGIGDMLISTHNLHVADNTTQLALKANQTDLVIETNARLSDKADNASQLATKADKTYTDTQIASLASGSPKGVYATLALLQAAFPTGNTNTYVVTADGKWYYWNTSAWTAGAVYQGLLLADSVVLPNNMADGMPALKSRNMYNALTTTPNFSISNTTGALVASTVNGASDFIPIVIGQPYIFPTTSLAVYNASFVYLGGNASIGTYTTGSAKYIRFTIPNTMKNLFMVYAGAVLPEDYVPYGHSVVSKNGIDPLTDGDKYTATKANVITAINELLMPDVLLYNQGDPVGGTLNRYVDLNSPMKTNVVEVTYNATTSGWGYKAPLGTKSVLSLGYGVGDYIQLGYYFNNVTATGFDYASLIVGLSGVATRFYNKATLQTRTLTGGWTYRYSRYQITQQDMDAGMTINEFSFTTSSTAGALVNYKIQCPIITLSHDLLNLSDVLTLAITNAKAKDTVFHFNILNTLGDSITQQGKWQGEVVWGLRFQKYRNYGIGGTHLSGNAADDMVNRYLTMDDNADVVIVMGGTNDHSQQIAIGDDVTYDKTTFKGALRVLIEGLMVKYHDKKIFFMTPPHKSFAGTIPMRTYAEAIKSICYDYSIPVIDLFGESGINNSNIDIYLADGTHPNELGGTRIGDFVARKMKTF